MEKMNRDGEGGSHDEAEEEHAEVSVARINRKTLDARA
jgi:hypothetical protein